MVGRFGARPSLLAAGVLITTASVLLTFLTTTTPVWALLVVFAVFGIGFSMINAPITNAAVSGMPLDRAGAASAVTSTSRQIGVSIGVALCGSVAGAAIAQTRRGLRDCGATTVVRVRRTRHRHHGARLLLDHPACLCFGRAARTADRRRRRSEGGVNVA